MSEQQLQLLIGMGRDRLTGAPLGRAYQQFASRTERVQERTSRLSLSLDTTYQAQLIIQIETEGKERGTRHAVASSTTRSACRRAYRRSGRWRMQARNP